MERKVHMLPNLIAVTVLFTRVLKIEEGFDDDDCSHLETLLEIFIPNQKQQHCKLHVTKRLILLKVLVY